MLDHAVQAVLSAYPTIHAACRRREGRGAPRRGLPPRLAGLLEHLDPVTPVVVGELARQLRVTPATVSLQLSRLARLRLVARARDAADGRRVELRLTDAGARVREARTLLDPERVRAALTRLEPPERDAVVAGVRLLARAAQELPLGVDKSAPPRRPRRAAE